MKNELDATKTKSVWVNIVLSVSVFILLAMMCETSARLFVWIRYGNPNHGFPIKYSYAPYLIAVANDKFERSYPPKSDSFRVLLLGGSTMQYMSAIPVGAIGSNILGKGIEDINFGMCGHIANQSLVALSLYGIQLESDVIITLDGVNDAVTITKEPKPGIPYTNKYVETAVNRPFFNVLLEVARRSQFINCINELSERKIESSLSSDVKKTQAIIDKYIQTQNNITQICKGLNVKHVQVLQPYLYLKQSLSEKEQSLSKGKFRREFMMTFMAEADSACRENERFHKNDVIYINGNNAFAGIDDNCFIDECHLTEHGMELLIRYIFSQIKESL